MAKLKLIRITTVPISLKVLLKGQHKFMSHYYNVIGVSSNGQELQDVQKEEGIRVAELNMTRTIAPLKDVVSLWKFYKLCKKEQPFIVHSHTPKAGIIGMLAAKLANVPNRLHTVAGMPLLESEGLKRTLLNFVEKLTYSCANKVYPNSKGLKDIIIKHNFTKPNKLKVLANGSSNGIDTSYFNPELFTNTQKEQLKQQLGVGEDEFVFIFVGRLVGDKGINELVKAFSEISQKSKVESQKSNISAAERSRSQIAEEISRKSKVESQKLNTSAAERSRSQIVERGSLNSKTTAAERSRSQITEPTTSTPNSKLILVGPLETELDPLLPETLQEIANNQHIISVGWQQDVRPYFAISNVLVFPSYREGFPNVVLQAGAMGLPSIVTNINGCNEIIQNDVNGWVIPVKDEEALKTALENILLNQEAYIKAKTTARQLIKDKFEQQLVWEAILEEYRKIEAIC